MCPIGQRLNPLLIEMNVSDMYHFSAEDPREHLTLDVEDDNGTHMTIKHVTKNPAEQEASSLYQTPPGQTQVTSSGSGWVWDEQYQRNKYWDGVRWIWEQ